VADGEPGQQTPGEEAEVTAEDLAQRQDEDAPIVEITPSPSLHEETHAEAAPGAAGMLPPTEAEPDVDNLQRMLDVPLSLAVELGGTQAHHRGADCLRPVPGAALGPASLPA